MPPMINVHDDYFCIMFYHILFINIKVFIYICTIVHKCKEFDSSNGYRNSLKSNIPDKYFWAEYISPVINVRNNFFCPEIANAREIASLCCIINSCWLSLFALLLFCGFQILYLEKWQTYTLPIANCLRHVV